jgi:hypothetical protein
VARYHFITALRVGASRARVWDLVMQPPVWPSFWRWLRHVDLLERGDDAGVGARYRYEFGTALPYTLSFETRTVRSVAPAFLEARASGELEGSGLFQLTEHDDRTTDVTYTWLVETLKRWMNLLAPVARPVFSRNHDVLMRDFAVGLAAAVGGELIAIDNRTVSPSTPGFFELPAT